MTKYKQYFKKMCEDNQKEFDAFKVLHDKYRQDKKTYQEEYNQVGEPILKIIQQQESNLCLAMEKGKNNAYSTNLSEKFWVEVRTLFPAIDFIGAKIG